MWFFIVLGIKLILYPLLTIIVLALLKDLTFFARSWRYLFQDIRFKYVPVLGFGLYVKAKNSQNELENYVKMFEDKKLAPGRSLDILLINSPTNAMPCIFINEKKLLNEYYKVEPEVSYKTDFSEMPVKHSFIYDKGKRALTNRAIFAEIFFSKNLRKIAPSIFKVIEKYVEKIKKRVNSAQEDSVGDQNHEKISKIDPKREKSESEKVQRKGQNPQNNASKGAIEVDLQEYSLSIFTEITGLVLFGEEVPEVEGVKLTELILKSVALIVSTAYKLPNVLSFRMYRKLGFQSEYNEGMRLKEIINKKLSETVQRRANSKSYKRGVNVIDLILNKNEELEALGRSDEKLTPIEIIHNIYILIFAGVDTSKNTSEFSLYHLSRHPGLQASLRAHLTEKLYKNGLETNYDSYDDCEILGRFMKEALRLYSPAWTGFPRVVTKDFNLGKHTIYKGTSIFIPYAALHNKPEYYGEAGTFNEARFERKEELEKFSKHGYQPFGLGRRACIGKNLAEISVSMALACFLKHFELVEGSVESRFVVEGSYGLEHCKVRLRAL